MEIRDEDLNIIREGYENLMGNQSVRNLGLTILKVILGYKNFLINEFLEIIDLTQVKYRLILDDALDYYLIIDYPIDENFLNGNTFFIKNRDVFVVNDIYDIYNTYYETKLELTKK